MILIRIVGLPIRSRNAAPPDRRRSASTSRRLAFEPLEGRALLSVAGDFNRDGFADLAIGAPGEGVGNHKAAGAMTVLYGSRSGLATHGVQFWTQDNVGGRGAGAEADNHFGATLAAGDFDGDGFADLAVGAPDGDINGIAAAGAVFVLYGSPSGLTADGARLWHQGSDGVLGKAEKGDGFGSALAAGDFDGDGRADLAVGVPGEDVGTVADAGAVSVFRGAASGLTATGAAIWDQNSPGVPGAAGAGDRFGSALAAGATNSYDTARPPKGSGPPGEPPGIRIDEQEFLRLYRQQFGEELSRSQVEGLKWLLSFLERDRDIKDLRWAAYMLATVKHEVANTWEPIEEYGKGAGQPYGQPDPDTGEVYYGRGYVQLTWKKSP